VNADAQQPPVLDHAGPDDLGQQPVVKVRF
jgi:hypothetical protein